MGTHFFLCPFQQILASTHLYALVWARGHDDSGGAPGPSTPSGKNGYKTMFVKRMEGNFSFIVKPSVGPGDVPTGASPGLGGGLQSL